MQGHTDLTPMKMPPPSLCTHCSGATPDYPGFLQYNLRLQANIRPVPPARLAFPPSRPKPDQDSAEVGANQPPRVTLVAATAQQ